MQIIINDLLTQILRRCLYKTNYLDSLAFLSNYCHLLLIQRYYYLTKQWESYLVAMFLINLLVIYLQINLLELLHLPIRNLVCVHRNGVFFSFSHCLFENFVRILNPFEHIHVGKWNIKTLNSKFFPIFFVTRKRSCVFSSMTPEENYYY